MYTEKTNMRGYNRFIQSRQVSEGGAISLSRHVNLFDMANYTYGTL